MATPNQNLSHPRVTSPRGNKLLAFPLSCPHDRASRDRAPVKQTLAFQVDEHHAPGTDGAGSGTESRHRNSSAPREAVPT